MGLTTRTTVTVLVSAAAAMTLVGGCADSGGEAPGAPADPARAATAPPSSPPSSPSTPPRAVLPDRRTVEVGGAELVLECRGAGAPTIVLEAGTDSSGLEVFPDDFLDPLAHDHKTCTYDRQGTGGSTAPREKRRTIDDLVADLHRLLRAARVPGPYLMMGSSGGGLVTARFAISHPGAVAGLVLLDVGVPNPHLGAEFPGSRAWDNVEHVDWVDAELQLFRAHPEPAEYPLLIVVASDSEMPDQRFWLRLSTRGEQVVLPGGHDMYSDYPAETAARIRESLDAL